MQYSHQDIQLAFMGSRSLNQMKMDINTFLAMFVQPYDNIAVSKYGKFKELRTLQLTTCLADIRTDKAGINLRIRGHGGHSFDNGAEYISTENVEEVWLDLFQLLDILVELIPEIQENVSFFRGIGQRTADRNKQE